LFADAMRDPAGSETELYQGTLTLTLAVVAAQGAFALRRTYRSSQNPRRKKQS